MTPYMSRLVLRPGALEMRRRSEVLHAEAVKAELDFVYCMDDARAVELAAAARTTVRRWLACEAVIRRALRAMEAGC
jgi:hypothetical protein